VRAFWERKVSKPLLDLLASGMTADQIALSIVLGAVLGVFPILGFPTMLCILAALVLRLNLPALQLVNYLVYPLQLTLLIPFIRLGGWLFPSAHASPKVLDTVNTAMHAAGAWFCVCAPAGLVLYVFLAVVLRIMKIGNRKAECPTKTPTYLTPQIQPAPLM
jgi:uncharacterized protein (DUF2062 family)